MDGVARLGRSRFQLVVKADLRIGYCLLKMYQPVVFAGQRAQFSVMGGRKTDCFRLIQRLQDFGGSRNPLGGVGSPQHLVKGAEDKPFLSLFVKDTLQGPDLCNIIAFSRQQIV